jgi:hypothetical protein
MTMHFLPEHFAEFPESSDRRARVRRSPATLAYLEAGENNGGIVANVSETGLAVSVAQPFAETQIPLLSFRLPQLDRQFQTSGEIVWHSESKKTAGIRFVNLAEPDRMQIRNWIRAEIVAAELQTPQEPKAARATAKPVLIMPSPRKVARLVAELEAARDEARAAEFDRMFPSEASLNMPQGNMRQENVRQAADESELDSEIVEAAKAANEATAFLAQEGFGREIAGPPESLRTSETIAPESPESQIIEVAATETPEIIDWREEWQRFHLQREKTELKRTYEMTVPTPMLSILDATVIEKPDAVQASLSAAREEWPNPVEATGIVVRREEIVPEQVVSKQAVAERVISEKVVSQQVFSGYPDAAKQMATRGVAAKRTGEKSKLGIAALACVLVAMCFVLGYAIQPGAFRFAAAKPVDVEPLSPAPVAEGPSARETAPAAAVGVPSPENKASDIASSEGTPLPEQKVQVQADVSKNPGTPDNGPVANEVQPAATATLPVGKVKKPSPAVPPAQAAAPETPAAAPIVPPTLTIQAPVPVSFFPVTAPSGGSPPKMMQLPEETVSETPSLIIRAREFLFVPAQPGPESTHELERVHVGDRVLKVDPTLTPSAPGNAQIGVVHLRATIGTDGAVADVQPISGPTALISAAVNAIRQWRYKPTDIDGKPIALEEDVMLEFSANH